MVKIIALVSINHGVLVTPVNAVSSFYNLEISGRFSMNVGVLGFRRKVGQARGNDGDTKQAQGGVLDEILRLSLNHK